MNSAQFICGAEIQDNVNLPGLTDEIAGLLSDPDPDLVASGTRPKANPVVLDG
jgi:hypothetical protein